MTNSDSIIYFFDTNVLLDLGLDCFNYKFVVSQMTLDELESIKTSFNKDPETKYVARILAKQLRLRAKDYDVVTTDRRIVRVCKRHHLNIMKPDYIILSAAYYYKKKYKHENVKVVTGDNSAANTALKIFKMETLSVYDIISVKGKYTGFIEVSPSDAELDMFYSNPEDNVFNALDNQYVVLKDAAGIKTIGVYKWHEGKYQHIGGNIKSKYFGQFTPKDIYQKMAIDNITSNQCVMLKGPAGSGKSLISISYLMMQLEHGEIDKIVIFANPVPMRGAAKIGFLPGSKDEKLLDSSIGNMLAQKLGGKDALMDRIQSGDIELLPTSDIRGYDTGNLHVGVYITEAQNLSSDMLMTAIQRCAENAKIIIDGDNEAQVDDIAYSGITNGMYCMSEAFRGEDIYGEVEMKEIYRSRMARIAEKMKKVRR